MKRVVQDDHFKTDPPANMPRGLVRVAGYERRILSHPGSLHHRRFLRFTYEAVAYQCKVLLFGLSLAPRAFTRCMDAALSPLRQMGIRILNYLDDWLILAQSQAVLSSHKTLLLSHLGCLGLCQEHTVTQPTSFLPGHSYRLSADDSNCLSGVSRNNSTPRGLLKGRYRPSAQSFPENAGPYGSGFTGTSVGSASHATHQFLAETEGSIRGLALRTPPLKQGMILDTEHRRKVVTTDASNKGWGALCEGKPTLGLWSEEESDLHINCLEMLAVCQACQFFLPDITPCANTLRQQVRGHT